MSRKKKFFSIIKSIQTMLLLFEWRLVSGLWLLSTAGGAYEIVPASSLSLIMAELKIGPSAAGWIISMSIVSQAVLVIPLGVLLDRVRIGSIIEAGVIAFLIGSLSGYAAALSGNYWMLLLSRGIGGFGFITLFIAGLRIISQYTDMRAHSLGFYTSSIPAGFVIGHLTGPFISATIGWEAIFVAYIGLTLSGFILFKKLVPPESQHGLIDDIPTPDVEDFAVLLSRPGTWTICTMGFISSSVFLVFNSWMPTYLSTVFQISFTESGALVALFPLIGLFGRAGSGLFSDIFFGEMHRSATRASFLAGILCIVSAILANRSLFLLSLLILLTSFFMQVAMGLYFTYLSEIVDRSVTTTALSLLTFSGLLGAAIAPVFSGYLIDQFDSYLSSLILVLFLTIIGFIAAGMSPRANSTTRSVRK